MKKIRLKFDIRHLHDTYRQLQHPKWNDMHFQRFDSWHSDQQVPTSSNLI
jgi:hypothetical protein